MKNQHQPADDLQETSRESLQSDSREIVVRLKGGMGNQLFQYAVARALAIREDCQLVLDVGWFKRKARNRSFKLSEFQCAGSQCSYSKFRYRWNRLTTGAGVSSALGNTLLIDEPVDHGYREIPKDLPHRTLLDGYWQSPKYFEHCRELLLRELKPRSDVISGLELPSENTVAVHVRRGDYMSGGGGSDSHAVSERYIRDAMSRFDSSHDFMFFSDDLDWCRERFGGGNICYSGASTDVQDLILMSQAAHNIIANSSFSWWGAWLNQNEGQRVVSPEPWTSAGSHQDILVDRWERIAI